MVPAKWAQQQALTDGAAKNVPPVIAIGGRDGPGHRINGEYVLVEDRDFNGRPCWSRRPPRQSNILQAGPPASAPKTGLNRSAAKSTDEKEPPVYIFFSDLGYWTVAASMHAGSAHTYARSGPDFSCKSPTKASMPWMVFVHGKAQVDFQVACFALEPPQALPAVVHLSGCEGHWSRLMYGRYFMLSNALGSRPLYVKGSSSQHARVIIHFSPQAGQWLASSVGAEQVHPDGSMVWQHVTTLAKSSTAWQSHSPDDATRGPWQLLSQSFAPPSRKSFPSAAWQSEEESVEYVPCPTLQVTTAPVTHHKMYGVDVADADSTWASETPLSTARTSNTASPRRDARARRPGASPGVSKSLSRSRKGGRLKKPMKVVSINLRSREGDWDPYELNGDYAWYGLEYGQMPAFLKKGVCSSEPHGSLELHLFFDISSSRWHISPRLGDVIHSIARSASKNAADAGMPADLKWQLRSNESAPPNTGPQSRGLSKSKSNQGRTSKPAFNECDELCLQELPLMELPRTLAFGMRGPGDRDRLQSCHLAGDFELCEETHGCRPLYKRCSLSSYRSPALYLFFEPRSGFWVISEGSPSSSQAMPAGMPGAFAGVFARSGPAWDCLWPGEGLVWEVAKSPCVTGKGCESLGWHADATGSLLHNDAFVAAPALSLCALGISHATVPAWLAVGGFSSRARVLNGTYDLMEEVWWSSRPAWQRRCGHDSSAAAQFPKYIFFWQESGQWVMGPELHDAGAGLARSPAESWSAECPDELWRRWQALNGARFQGEPHAFVRRQTSQAGGVKLSPVPSPRSPRFRYEDRDAPASSRSPTRSVDGARPPISQVSLSSPRCRSPSEQDEAEGPMLTARRGKSPRLSMDNKSIASTIAPASSSGEMLSARTLTLGCLAPMIGLSPAGHGLMGPTSPRQPLRHSKVANSELTRTQAIRLGQVCA